MRCTVGRRSRVRISHALLFGMVPFFMCIHFLESNAAQKASPPRDPSSAATNVRCFLFNLASSRSHSVTKNGVLLTTSNSSVQGVVAFADAMNSGDRYAIAESGSGAQPPSPPSGLAAEGSDVGCAQLAWNQNPEADVDGYRLYYGAESVAGGESSFYDDSLDVPDGVSKTVCGFADGTYYFAVRAHNTAGLLSAASEEVSASISNGGTQPPLPPLLLSVSEGDPGCIDVSWLQSGSPDVVGYVVAFGTSSVEGGDATAYDDTVHVGSVSSYTITGLQIGTYYVAVQSLNQAGLPSAYSDELSALVTSTAVFIVSFECQVVPGGVELVWEIFADEPISGYRIYREREGEGTARLLNGGLLIAPDRTRYVDREFEPAATLLYTLGVLSEDGTERRSQVVRVSTPAVSLGLSQNVPNPFNPATTISFTLPEPTHVRLAVFEVSGALVRVLADGYMGGGLHTAFWDGTNSSGAAVSSGTYFYRLTAGKGSITRKMILLK